MDKTTTWLVRGAAIVVISSGVIALFSFLKPDLIQFTLSKEEKEKIAIEKAEKRCKKFKTLSKTEFLEMLRNNEIKKGFYSPSFFQVNTKKGKYLLGTIDQLINLSADGIPVHRGKTVTETYNKICRYDFW